MMVMAVVAGSVYNVLTSRAPLPWYIYVPVDVAGQAFRPLVLVIGGMSLSGSIGHLASLRLAVLPTLLVVLKSVMLPILALYYVFLLNPNGSLLAGSADFVFYYCVLPVATSSLAIASSYQVAPELLSSLASALLLGKIVAFSLLFFAAYIITYGYHVLVGCLKALSTGLHSLSVLAGLVTLVLACNNPQRRARERGALLGLAGLQVAYSVSFLLARYVAFPSIFKWTPHSDMEFLSVHIAIFTPVFGTVSLFRWACNGWILTMAFDQYRRTFRTAAWRRRHAASSLPNFPRCHGGGGGAASSSSSSSSSSSTPSSFS